MKSKLYAIVPICAVWAALLIADPPPLAADSSWEGTAAVSRYGELPVNGYYAASNSFPWNTRVRVSNAENGNSVTVTVTQGLDEPGIFILLSREAAEELRVGYTLTTRVRVTPLPNDVVRQQAYLQESPESRDPDLNPAAAVEGDALPATPASAPPAAVAPEEPGATVMTAENSEAEQEGETPWDGPPQVDGVIEDEPSPAVTGTNPLLEEQRQEQGQDQEKDQDKPAVAAPVSEEPVGDLAELPPPEPEKTGVPEMPEESAVSGGTAGTESERAGEEAPLLAEEPAAEPPAPEPVLPDNTGTELTLVPAEPRPPAVAAVPAQQDSAGDAETPEDAVIEGAADDQTGGTPAEPSASPSPPIAAAEVDIHEGGRPADAAALRDDAYYLQIGAYASRTMAERVGASLETAYPLTLVPDSSGGKAVYRVLVGPFGEDEQGVILYHVRAKGYRDAFVRRGGR